MGNLLEKIITFEPISREHYGIDSEKKPNNHCFWCDMGFMFGWMETDSHLRKRIINNYKIESL